MVGLEAAINTATKRRDPKPKKPVQVINPVKLRDEILGR